MRRRWWAMAAVGWLVACGDDGTGAPGPTTTATGAGASTSGAGASTGVGAMGGAGGAGGTGTGGTTSSGAGGGGAGGADPCATFSDELDDPATLSCWTRRHQQAAEPAQYEVLDVDTTVLGALVLEPLSSGWFEEDMGPLLYKEVVGDFVVEVDVSAVDEGDESLPPSSGYHSAGLMVRDPTSAAGDQNWLMYNLGYQETFVGTEGKTTEDSTSILTLLPGEHTGRLRICRLGSSFTMWRQFEGDTSWTQEHTYDRADLPSTLQVGMITNAWPPAQPLEGRNIQARFRSIHLGMVQAVGDCTAPIVAR